MSSHLFAVGNRARLITSLAALLAAAVLIAALTPGGAKGGRSARVLADSAGMGNTPPSLRVRAAQGQRAPSETAERTTQAAETSRELLGLGGSRPGSAIAGGIVGGLSGAIAALMLGLHRGRRRRGRPTIGFRESAGRANVTPQAGKSPDKWTPYVTRKDAPGPIRTAAAGGGASPAEPSRGRALIGYVTVTADMGPADAARSSATIEATCKRSDWNLLEIVGDRENGRILERPGLGYALGRIAQGYASGLIVSDLQCLSCSIVDLGALMAWFRDANATFIALDLGINTSTAEGDHVATTLIALSDCAHERIADRTRNRLAEKRANGDSNGRPAVRDRPELMERIAAMRAGGLTLQAIADELNADHVPTLRGGAKWRPSSIQAALGYRRPGPRDHLPRLTRDGP
jgi:DNA invertase Pin-like site-specific DNA recombinase